MKFLGRVSIRIRTNILDFETGSGLDPFHFSSII